MDGFSFALALVASFKEVYLLSKFIHQTIITMKNNKAQRRELGKEFQTQVLFLQSLGLLLFGGNGITNNAALDPVRL
jgi:hypothetical protein